MKKLANSFLILIALMQSTFGISQFIFGPGNAFGRTTPAIEKISIGNFPVNGDVLAKLHLNQFRLGANTATDGFLFRTDGNEASDNRWQLFTGTTADTQTERFRIRTLANGFDTYLTRTQPGSETEMRFLTAQLEIWARGKRLGDFCEAVGANLSDIVQFGDGTNVNTLIHNANTQGSSFWGSSGTVRSGAFYDEHAPSNVQLDVIKQDVLSGGVGPLEVGDFYVKGRLSADTNTFISLANGTLVNGSSLPMLYAYNNVGLAHGLAVVGAVNIANDVTNPIGPGVIEFDARTKNPANDAPAGVANRMLFRFCNYDVPMMAIESGGQIGIRTITPANRLDINSQNGDPYFGTPGGSSGLRLRNMTSLSAPAPNPGAGVLTVDSDGNVIYADAGNSICDWNLLTNGTSDDLVMGYAGSCNEGNTGIGVDLPAAKLDVFKNSAGFTSNETGVNIRLLGGQFASTGLNVDLASPVLSVITETIGIHARSIGSRDRNFGGFFEALNVEGSTSAVGVFAVAGDPSLSLVNTGVQGEASFAKFNLGVFGHVTSQENYGYGIGVAGTAEGTYDFTGEGCAKLLCGVAGVANAIHHVGYFSIGVLGRVVNIPEDCSNAAWAGFFDGNVMVDGDVIANNFTPSDENLKQNIQNIEGALDLIDLLVPKTYEFQCENYPNLNLQSGQHRGFIAQQVEEILPGITKEVSTIPEFDAEGNIIQEGTTILTMNYTELHAIEIAAIKELKSLVLVLQEQLNACCNVTADTRSAQMNVPVQSDIVLKDVPGIVLKQNIPNPMEESSTIQFNIDDDFENAEIIFYDSLGKRVNSHRITTKGQGQLNVFADDLSSGIYSYVLVVDGKVIDTKKLVRK